MNREDSAFNQVSVDRKYRTAVVLLIDVVAPSHESARATAHEAVADALGSLNFWYAFGSIPTRLDLCKQCWNVRDELMDGRCGSCWAENPS